MSLGSPIAVMLLFSLLAFCAVLFAIPALRSPPPGVSSKLCTNCKSLSPYNAERCKRCGGPVIPLDDDDHTDKAPHDDDAA